MGGHLEKDVILTRGVRGCGGKGPMARDAYVHAWGKVLYLLDLVSGLLEPSDHLASGHAMRELRHGDEGRVIWRGRMMGRVGDASHGVKSGPFAVSC